jgi:hypothetical protein
MRRLGYGRVSVPVAFLVFNRPDETARVLEAIAAARPKRLLVVADGPRAEQPEDAGLVEQVRDVIARGVTWPCSVERLYSDENLGCGKRVRSGLDWVFAEAPEAIVLEDDCLPHPSFFGFCEAMLARYRDDERVHMIAGTNYFSDPGRSESYFFTRYVAIWGWASWARAWQHDSAMASWPAAREAGVLEGSFGHQGLARWMRELFDAAYEGRVDTWDIQWVWESLAQHRLAIVPRVNLVSNIGFAGTHGPGGANLGMATADVRPGKLLHPVGMLPDIAYEERLYREFLLPPPTPRRERIRAALRAATHQALRPAVFMARPVRKRLDGDRPQPPR